MSEITKENFIWKTGDKQTKLEDMDVDFKLAALIHCVKLSNKYHQKLEQVNQKTERLLKEIEKLKQTEKNYEEEIEKLKESSDHFFNETEKFVDMTEILEDSLKEDHNLNVPNYGGDSDIKDLWAFRRLYNKGLISQTNESISKTS